MARFTAPALAILLLLRAQPGDGATGVYLEEEVVKSMAGSTPTLSSSRTWIVPGKLRKEEGASGTVTIVAGSSLQVANAKDRTWYELDRESFEQLGKMGMAVLLEGREQDAREWFVRSGRERRVGPWLAYEVVAEDKPIPGTRFSIWLSREVPIDPKLKASAEGAFGAGNPGARFLEALRTMEGYPVEIQLVLRAGSATMEVRQTLKKVEPMEIGDERFEIPADYRRIESPLSAVLEAKGKELEPARGKGSDPQASPQPERDAVRPAPAPAPAPTGSGSPSDAASPAASPSPALR